MSKEELKGSELLESFDSIALEKQKKINPNFENSFIDKTEILRISIEKEAQKNKLKKLISEYSKAYRSIEVNPIFYRALFEFINYTKGNKSNVAIRTIFLSFLKVPRISENREISGLNTKNKNRKNWGRPSVLKKCGLSENKDFLDMLKELKS